MDPKIFLKIFKRLIGGMAKLEHRENIDVAVPGALEKYKIYLLACVCIFLFYGARLLHFLNLSGGLSKINFINSLKESNCRNSKGESITSYGLLYIGPSEGTFSKLLQIKNK
jgi:hypothetical protein